MNKTFSSIARTTSFSFLCLLLFAQVGQASDALHFFKNYFVTGDYVVGGVGLRGTGDATGYATGVINIGGAGPNGSSPVPVTNGVPADVVAAFLYWQADEPVSAVNPSAMNGFFDGHPIVGAVIGNPQNPSCEGLPNAWWTRGYRADVMRYLAIDHVNNVRIANGPHTVRLPDSGAAATGPFTHGASLVIIYRVVVPGNPLVVPLSSVVIYDGAFTFGNGSSMTQTIAGFYQAYQTSPQVPSKMTAIVGNGQAGFTGTLNVTTAVQSPAFNNPFTGAAGARWDNPTFNINLGLNESSYSLQATANGQACHTAGSIVTKTLVVDTDHDGLLDIWETAGLHLNNQGSPATFGSCSDFPSESCVNLPAMGANPNVQDIFIEADWLQGDDGHLHIPKLPAVTAVATSFAAHLINLHFDLGNNYQGLGLPFIIPAAYARGGEVIEESSLVCPNAYTSHCAFSVPYSVLGWKKGFHAVKDGFPALGITAHFDHDRKDIFHYALFAHALGVQFDPPNGTTKSVSGVSDRPGGDFMVTFGLWRSDDPADDQTGTPDEQQGTIMHELGHNLDLSHAGLNRSPNCMPNYMSVMNYLYQTRLLTLANGTRRTDYSMGQRKPIDEGHLSEALSYVGSLPFRMRFFGVPGIGEGVAKAHCDGTPILDGASAIRLETFDLTTPDWNHNGIRDRSDYALDVNFSGSLQDGVAGGPLFIDSNDWSSLNLQQVGARLNVNGLSADVGQTDLGQTDLGQTDLGQTDLGQTDLGQTDLGQTDLGQTDLGQTDLGDVDYDTVIATLDATDSEDPLIALNTSDRIKLSWGAPTIGQIRAYNIYRSDPAHPVPAFLATFAGVPPVPGYDDVVNDFVHSGSSCPSTSTCYNTSYTYFVTSKDVNNTVSAGSNKATSKVTHLFVIADNQTIVYGTPNPPLTFHAFGEVSASLSGVSCAFAIAPLVPKNAGNYAIVCAGPASTSATDGVTYNAAYYDGATLHSPGSLNITKANAAISVTGYRVAHDGAAHTATGTAVGVNGENLSGLNLGATTHTAVGTYSNDPWTFTDVTGNYKNAVGTVSDAITKALTTTKITSDTPDPSTAGQPVLVQVAVAPQSGGVPTGTVTVGDGFGAHCSAVLTAGLGSCSLTPIVVGTRNLTATYTGDTNFVGSMGTAAHQVVP